jgi:hypothetical protein
MKPDETSWMVKHVPFRLIEQIKLAALKNKRWEYLEVIDRLERSFSKEYEAKKASLKAGQKAHQEAKANARRTINKI